MDPLQTSIEYLKGVGPNRAQLFREELQINTFQDLLHFFPNRYIDRSTFYSVAKLPQTPTEIQLKGKIISLTTVAQKRGKRLVVKFQDESGVLELVWFRGIQWIKSSLQLHQNYVIFGRINWYKGHPTMPHPELELEEDFQQGVKGLDRKSVV